MAAGAIIGTAVGGPVGTIIGAVGGLASSLLGIGSALINPERSALRNQLEQQGFPKGYAEEYAKSAGLSVDQLWARADKLLGKGDVEGAAAVRVLVAEQVSGQQAQTAMQVAAEPRSGAIPLWAPAALLAIVALGVALLLRRRS